MILLIICMNNYYYQRLKKETVSICTVSLFFIKKSISGHSILEDLTKKYDNKLTICLFHSSIKLL